MDLGRAASVLIIGPVGIHCNDTTRNQQYVEFYTSLIANQRVLLLLMQRRYNNNTVCMIAMVM